MKHSATTDAKQAKTQQPLFVGATLAKRTSTAEVDVAQVTIPSDSNSDSDDSSSDSSDSTEDASAEASSNKKRTGRRGQAKRHRYPLSFRKTCLDFMDERLAAGSKHAARDVKIQYTCS